MRPSRKKKRYKYGGGLRIYVIQSAISRQADCLTSPNELERDAANAKEGVLKDAGVQGLTHVICQLVRRHKRRDNPI